MELLTLDKEKHFTNGSVYLLRTQNGNPVEVTDTFLPIETKYVINTHCNAVTGACGGSRDERWMIGVSTMSGCPVGCKFCSTGMLKKLELMTTTQIVEQIFFITNKYCPKHWPHLAKEFKINYTRMGEPFLNIENVKEAIKYWPQAHHYLSTIGVNGSDFSFVKDNISLQFSIHSLNEEKRNWLIPYKNKMTLKEIGQVRTGSKLKTTLNLTLVDEADFDIKVLKEYFDPQYFFIKVSPLNENVVSRKNLLNGVVEYTNLL
jgi:adenine C2-methylase RlmN of 23S rRNA A2503 and tRNA A37